MYLGSAMTIEPCSSLLESRVSRKKQLCNNLQQCKYYSENDVQAKPKSQRSRLKKKHKILVLQKKNSPRPQHTSNTCTIFSRDFRKEVSQDPNRSVLATYQSNKLKGKHCLPGLGSPLSARNDRRERECSLRRTKHLSEMPPRFRKRGSEV